MVYSEFGMLYQQRLTQCYDRCTLAFSLCVHSQRKQLRVESQIVNYFEMFRPVLFYAFANLFAISSAYVCYLENGADPIIIVDCNVKYSAKYDCDHYVANEIRF